MKLEINDYCIRCGICVDLYPDIFQRNYETHNIDVLFDEIPEDKQERAVMAAADCAVASIKVIGDTSNVHVDRVANPIKYYD